MQISQDIKMHVLLYNNYFTINSVVLPYKFRYLLRKVMHALMSIVEGVKSNNVYLKLKKYCNGLVGFSSITKVMYHYGL
jgi:hypothetical protein